MAPESKPDMICDATCQETLQEFFTEVLGLDEKTSGEGARKLQQTVSAEIVERIVTYTAYVKSIYSKEEGARVCSFKQYLQK